ncbi:MAG: MotA/TolQ/ExbB proton channel family protein [Planctomycetales bacterium]|nr:MotA/TolQ/ExbB proton channel family protein [Planctomycetales bacterium]
MSRTGFSQLGSTLTQLSWHHRDIEQRLFFSGGRFTRVNTLLSFLLAVVLIVCFYVTILAFPESWLNNKFIGQGVIPYSIAFFTAWSAVILFIKWRKLQMQKRCLAMRIVPEDSSFVLSPANVDEVIEMIHALVDDPRQFVLFNRISIALSNLRNMGRVSDVDEIMRTQGESDEAISDSSYVVLGGFLWAIPILGFIGTVLGLSIAIGEFGSVMSASGKSDALLGALKLVTGGLGLAFDTTLEALVAALAIQLTITFLRKSEQEFLDGCSEYCTRQIVNKLRLLPFHDGGDGA